MSAKMPTLLVFLAAGVLIIIGFSAGGSTGEVQPPRQVSVATKTLLPAQSLRWDRQLAGLVEAGRRAQLAFELTGLVAEVLVDDGDDVHAGQVLARLSTPTLLAEHAAAEAEHAAARSVLAELQAGPRAEVLAATAAAVQAAEAEAAVAAADARRFNAAGGSVSAQAMNNAQQRSLAAAARLAEARQGLAELTNGTRPEQVARQQAEVAAAQARVALSQARLEQAHVVAPFAGHLLSRKIDEGSLVTPGQVVLVIQETAELEARFAVPRNLESALPALGSTVSMVTGTTVLTGTVLGVVPERDSATRALALRVRLGASPPSVRPGDWLSLEVQEQAGTPGWIIPRDSLREAERGQWSVLIAEPADGSQVVGVRQVLVLRAGSQGAWVTGNLAAGDKLIVGGHQYLLPGMAVQARSGP